jgi:hypothetical protein
MSVHGMQHPTRQDLIPALDACHRRVGAAQLELLQLIAEVDRQQLWQGTGARDCAHWLVLRYGISSWKASRWIAAARALGSLPRIAEALGSGQLGIDKVVELTRFAAPKTEEGLVRWAQGVSCGCIRRRGDLVARQDLQEVRDTDRSRRLSWWYEDEGRRFGLQAELPAAEGAVVAQALERLAHSLPIMPGEEGAWGAEARRADALVALARTRIGADPDPDRATVVVHASLEAMASADHGVELEAGPVLHPEIARRLLCSGRLQVVGEDEAGDPVHVGRLHRIPPAWMLRQLKYRDRECRFPGCGTRAFTQAHHITWWDQGGRTELSNLVLICAFHHKLVHEYGWTLHRENDGDAAWFHPDGTRYRAGPAPPESADLFEPQRGLAAAGA